MSPENYVKIQRLITTTGYELATAARREIGSSAAASFLQPHRRNAELAADNHLQKERITTNESLSIGKNVLKALYDFHGGVMVIQNLTLN